MSDIANERTKLLANVLDRASTACFTVGVAAPLAARVGSAGGIRQTAEPLALTTGAFGWLLACLLLHIGARRALGRLMP